MPSASCFMLHFFFLSTSFLLRYFSILYLSPLSAINHPTNHFSHLLATFPSVFFPGCPSPTIITFSFIYKFIYCPMFYVSHICSVTTVIADTPTNITTKPILFQPNGSRNYYGPLSTPPTINIKLEEQKALVNPNNADFQRLLYLVYIQSHWNFRFHQMFVVYVTFPESTQNSECLSGKWKKIRQNEMLQLLSIPCYRFIMLTQTQKVFWTKKLGKIFLATSYTQRNLSTCSFWSTNVQYF